MTTVAKVNEGSKVIENMKALEAYDPNSFRQPPPAVWDGLLDVADHTAQAIGAQDPLTKTFLAFALLAAKVFDRKQRSYGPGNIAKFSDFGVLVRVHDKKERLVNLYGGGHDPAEEGRDDTWGDQANYSLIALMCRWGFWPGAKKAA